MEVGELVELLLPDGLGAEEGSEEVLAGEVDIEFFRGEQVVEERVGGEELLADELVQHLLHDLHAVLLHARTAPPVLHHGAKG